MADITKVGIVGAGTMGSGIAHVFARSGFDVLLCDVEQRFLDHAVAQIRANLSREASKGKITESDAEAALARIKSTLSREALAETEIAIEAAPERYALKAEIFRSLDAILPSHAILASNTSSISITKLAAIATPHAGHRDALLQPRADYGSGRSGARPHDQRLYLRHRPRTGSVDRQDPRRGRRHSRLRLQPSAHAAHQRGSLRGHGGRRDARGHRSGVQAGNGPPHGPAHAGRLHRHRRLRRYSARSTGRLW